MALQKYLGKFLKIGGIFCTNCPCTPHSYQLVSCLGSVAGDRIATTYPIGTVVYYNDICWTVTGPSLPLAPTTVGPIVIVTGCTATACRPYNTCADCRTQPSSYAVSGLDGQFQNCGWDDYNCTHPSATPPVWDGKIYAASNPTNYTNNCVNNGAGWPIFGYLLYNDGIPPVPGWISGEWLVHDNAGKCGIITACTFVCGNYTDPYGYKRWGGTVQVGFQSTDGNYSGSSSADYFKLENDQTYGAGTYVKHAESVSGGTFVTCPSICPNVITIG